LLLSLKIIIEISLEFWMVLARWSWQANMADLLDIKK